MASLQIEMGNPALETYITSGEGSAVLRIMVSYYGTYRTHTRIGNTSAIPTVTISSVVGELINLGYGVNLA